MPIVQCKHCQPVFVGGPFRIRAHQLGTKGFDLDKCCRIDVVKKVEVQKMISNTSYANVDVNGGSSMKCNAEKSSANVDVVESTSINEMPSSSFVNASTNKKMKVRQWWTLESVMAKATW